MEGINGERQLNTVNVVDLFCGAGGLSLGAAQAGFTVKGAVDTDPKAIDAHGRNFPGTIHMSEDIAKLTGRSIKRRLGLEKIGGLIGSPPCQGFSSIGKGDRHDPRNALFADFFRIVSEALPKFFLAENVPGIMQEKYRETRERAFSFVEKRYVMLPPLELAADKYGAATTRKRVFFVGYLEDSMKPLDVTHFNAGRNVKAVCVRDALCGLPTDIDPHWQTEKQSWRVISTKGVSRYAKNLRGHVSPGVGDSAALKRLRTSSEVSGFLGTVHSARVAKRYADTEPGKQDPVSKSYRLDLDGLCPTLRAGTGPDQGSFQAVRPLHPTIGRVITPREAARLQGFPDWFQFSPTKWHSFRQIGNSVSPILAKRVFTVIARALGVTNSRRTQ